MNTNKTSTKEQNQPSCLGGVGGSLIFKNGYKNADFIVFNPFNIKLKDEEPMMHEIKLRDNSFWNELRSNAWSSNCRFFFVINENHIIIGNTLDYKAFFCSNLSLKVFDHYLKAFSV